ncbi:MAG: ABC transporter substrate-binding protein [Actinomycetota bacterium]|nr:ABC transporter substrate-binding protein [Actinomycetota bacterium]
MEQSGILALANAPVLESLLSFSSDLSLEPLLAEGWEHRPPLSWRLLLRRGVRFHNGAPFDASAVVATVNRWGTGRNLMGLGPRSAVAVDEYTVDITPKAANHRLLEQLAHPGRRFAAPGTVPGTGVDPHATPTGTGPFRFVRYRPGAELTVERFEGYWGAPARLAALSFEFLPDGDARLAALASGRVHAIYDVPRHRTAEVRSYPARITLAPVGMYCALLLNHRGRPPYDILTDVRVRRALALAIDQDAIVAAWPGSARAEQTIVPSDLLRGSAPLIKGHGHDPDDAERLLDEAGWHRRADGMRERADGRPLRLEMLVYSGEEQAPAPALVAEQLAGVGVHVTTSEPDPHDYGDLMRAGQGDIFASVGNQADANWLFFASLFTGVTPGGAYGDRFGPGAVYDELVTEAYATPDPDESRRLTAQALAIVVDEAVTAVPLAALARVHAMSEGVRGFVAHRAKGAQRWSRVFLDTVP